MKKISVILLLLSFAARPVYQMGYFAYFELNLDYIIKTYCINEDKPELNCNGKCHLVEQLAMGTQDHNHSKYLNFGEVFYPVYFQAYYYKCSFLSLGAKKQSNNWSQIKNHKNRFLTILVPPPQV